MASDRIDVVRRMNAAFNAREPGWIEYYTEDAEFFTPAEWPEGAVLEGREGIARGAGFWIENLDEYRWEEDRLIEGPDCLVGLYRHRGRIRDTDQEIETKIGALFWFEGDQVSRVRSYTSWPEALTAAGFEDAVR